MNVVLALVVGGLLSCLTISVGTLSNIGDNAVIAAAQKAGFILLLAGWIGSMAFSGNVHAFYLWVAAIVNAGIYGTLSYVVLAAVGRRRRMRGVSSSGDGV